MGLLKELADAVGSENLQRLSAGQGNFDTPGSDDMHSLEELLRNIDPQQLQQILGRVAGQIDSRQYSDHVTPGVGGTNPLGNLNPAVLGSIATALLDRLRDAVGSGNLATLARQIGLKTTDPEEMKAEDVATVARYAQQNEPEAFGKAAAQVGQQHPGVLHGFLGKAALALAAAALASHFVKMDRR
ncbi:MAG TPA: hypothetical protein VMF30_05870 [Pirellulales bacterium]|nr:hypothetical protein [Pirellulales bacterium]